MSIRKLLLALVGLALIATAVLLWLKPGEQPAEQPGNTTATNEATPATPAGARALPEAEQLALAFKTAYGATKSATIETKDAKLTAEPGELLWVGDIAVLLSPTKSEADCHACAGTLAITYLKAKGDGFEVTGKWPDLIVGAGWGEAPDWKVTDAFTTLPAVYEEGSYMGQGVSCSNATITELKPGGPVQSELIWLSSSNGGAIDEETGKTFGGEPAKELEGKITDIVKGKSFTVKATGTASFTESYIYRDGKFVPTQPDSKLTC
jgi:hypothetical protein